MNLSKAYLSQIPIKGNPIYEKKIIEIVQSILEKTGEDYNVNIDSFRNEIDQLVYQLYDLTPEEIQIVEESIK